MTLGNGTSCRPLIVPRIEVLSTPERRKLRLVDSMRAFSRLIQASQLTRCFGNVSRQGEVKSGSKSIISGRPQPAAMRLHNGTADGQPHPAALRLGGKGSGPS